MVTVDSVFTRFAIERALLLTIDTEGRVASASRRHPNKRHTFPRIRVAIGCLSSLCRSKKQGALASSQPTDPNAHPSVPCKETTRPHHNRPIYYIHSQETTQQCCAERRRRSKKGARCWLSLSITGSGYGGTRPSARWWAGSTRSAIRASGMEITDTSRPFYLAAITKSICGRTSSAHACLNLSGECALSCPLGDSLKFKTHMQSVRGSATQRIHSAISLSSYQSYQRAIATTHLTEENTRAAAVGDHRLTCTNKHKEEREDDRVCGPGGIFDRTHIGVVLPPNNSTITKSLRWFRSGTRGVHINPAR